MRVFKGNVEVELSENEQLTLHHAVPQLPEVLVTFQRSAATVEIPAEEERKGDEGPRTGAARGSEESRHTRMMRRGSVSKEYLGVLSLSRMFVPPLSLPVAYVDDVTSPDVLLLYLPRQV